MTTTYVVRDLRQPRHDSPYTLGEIQAWEPDSTSGPTYTAAYDTHPYGVTRSYPETLAHVISEMARRGYTRTHITDQDGHELIETVDTRGVITGTYRLP